jgi:hypothetical protein
VPHQIEGVNRVVYVFDEDVLGYVISMGAFASKIQYSIGGIEHQVYVENTDFMLLEDK